MGYKDYRFNPDSGPYGYNVPAGVGDMSEIFKNRVVGAMIMPSTTGSSQLTGAGNGTYLYDISPGFVVVDGKVAEIAGAADQACETPADIMANGYSKIYMLIAYKTTLNVVTTLIVAGTAALTAAVAAPTPAEIEAAIPAGCPWVAIGAMQINRTGDTTVTEAVDNQYRPLFLPKTVHDA